MPACGAKGLNQQAPAGFAPIVADLSALLELDHVPDLEEVPAESNWSLAMKYPRACLNFTTRIKEAMEGSATTNPQNSKPYRTVYA